MRREALALGAEHPAADKPLSSTSTAARLRGLREARLGEAGMSLENLERKVEFDRNAGDLEVLAEERGSGPSDSYQQLRIYASSLAGLMRDENLPSPPATLFWHPRLKTDNSGNAVFDVPIPQRASVYQLRAAAHAGGRLGEVRRNFEVRPAIEVQAELPAVLTQEDRVQVAFEVTNRLETALQSSWSVNQTATRNLAASPEQLAVSVPPRSQQRVETELTATGTGSSRILWRLDHHPPDVELEQTLTVLPSNYPHDRVHSDRELPAMGWDLAGETGADTATSPRMLRLRVYPSLAAEILDAAAMLDRDGATSVWTALAAQQALDWLDDHSIASTALKRKLKRLAARPQALADEPLGAYHRAWLAWEYGFNTPSTGNSLPALDSLPEPADAFEMAAAARIASLAAQPSAEERLLQLIELQTEEGYLPCRRSFAALSSPDVTLEATALAVLAWSPPANAELYSKARDKALAWLRKQRRADGSFGAADATALVLLALVRDTSRPAVASEAGHVTLNHAQRAIATTTWMARASRPAIMDAVLDSTATATRLYVEEPLPKDLPYTLLLRAWSDVPPPSKAAPLRFETRLEPHELRVGESARMQVRVEGIAIPGVVLRIAIPAGCIVDMRDLPASCRMTDHELIVRVASPFSEPRDWVRSDQVLEFAFPVIARLAGSFRSTPSKAYPLHAPEAVSWAPPVEVKIAP